MALHDGMIDCPVYTKDGEQVGKVKEIRGAFFKVDAPMQPDYWLADDGITPSGDKVQLPYTSANLGDYKLGEPDDYVEGAGHVHESQHRMSTEQRADTEHREIGKREITETERVAGEVGREAPRIEPEGDVRMAGGVGGGGWTEVSSRYRQDWQTRQGTSDGRWEDYEPGYRYGYEMANDPRYQGRNFDEVESDLHRDYSGWSQRSGYQSDDNAWERIKQSARETFGEARNRRAA